MRFDFILDRKTINESRSDTEETLGATLYFVIAAGNESPWVPASMVVPMREEDAATFEVGQSYSVQIG